MIIIRGTETQSLPNQTGLPNKQYAGEGSALSQAGPAVAHVANQGVALKVQLNQYYNRLEGVQGGKQLHSDLRSDAAKFLDQWDQDYVQKGSTPEQSINAVDEFFKTYAASDKYGEATGSSNQYLREYAQSAFEDVKADTLAKAISHARAGYIAVNRERTKTALDNQMQDALLYDAKGDVENFQKEVSGSMSYLHQMKKDGLFNDAETATLEKNYRDNLEEKRAYNAVSRDPAAFLQAFHENKFSRLDPKVGQSLSVAADQALSRKVAVQDHDERIRTQALTDARTQMKNDFLTQATKDPVGALNQVQDLDTRRFLGPEYDNTLSTLRTIANPASLHNDGETVQHLNREIDLRPNQKLRNELDTMFQKGKLNEPTYTAMSHRLQERVDKFVDKAEQDRTHLTNQAINVYKPMLRVTGINDFDGTSSEAQQGLEEELILNLRQDPKLNPMIEGQRLMLKYRSYVDDHYLDVTATVAQKYGIKSEADAQKALIDKRISNTEYDKLHFYYNNQDKVTKPSSNSSSLTKKKK
jgi:hypothetical protein